MGRFSFYLTLFFYISLFQNVQQSNAQNIGLGVASGFNQSTHLNNFRFINSAGEAIDFELSPEYRTGYQYGLVLRRVLTDNLRFQIEPNYFLSGAAYNSPIILNGIEFQNISETELQYIQIPFLLQLTTTPPDRAQFPRPWPEFTFHLTGGAYAGYLLDATFSGSIRGTPIGVDFEESFENNVLDRFSRYDAGLIVGGGTEFGLNTKLGLEARLMYGLTNSGSSFESSGSTRNLAFYLSLYFIL